MDDLRDALRNDLHESLPQSLSGRVLENVLEYLLAAGWTKAPAQKLKIIENDSVFTLFRNDPLAQQNSYLFNHYKRGRGGIMRPRDRPALSAWEAGRLAAISTQQPLSEAAPAVQEQELLAGGWLPIKLCPTDGVDRLLRLSDNREVVGNFDSRQIGRNGWQIRSVAYHNPARIVSRRGGVDQWSQAYDTYLISALPDGVYPTHFRPNDTVHGAAKPTPPAEDDGPISESAIHNHGGE